MESVAFNERSHSAHYPEPHDNFRRLLKGSAQELDAAMENLESCQLKTGFQECRSTLLAAGLIRLLAARFSEAWSTSSNGWEIRNG